MGAILDGILNIFRENDIDLSFKSGDPDSDEPASISLGLSKNGESKGKVTFVTDNLNLNKKQLSPNEEYLDGFIEEDE
jgi:hypothetical protein